MAKCYEVSEYEVRLELYGGTLGEWSIWAIDASEMKFLIEGPTSLYVLEIEDEPWLDVNDILEIFFSYTVRKGD